MHIPLPRLLIHRKCACRLLPHTEQNAPHYTCKEALRCIPIHPLAILILQPKTLRLTLIKITPLFIYSPHPQSGAQIVTDRRSLKANNSRAWILLIRASTALNMNRYQQTPLMMTQHPQHYIYLRPHPCNRVFQFNHQYDHDQASSLILKGDFALLTFQEPFATRVDVNSFW